MNLEMCYNEIAEGTTRFCFANKVPLSILIACSLSKNTGKRIDSGILFRGDMKTGVCKYCGKEGELYREERSCRECHNTREQAKRKELRKSENCPYYLSREYKKEEARRRREKIKLLNPEPKNTKRSRKPKPDNDRCRHCGVEIPGGRKSCTDCKNKNIELCNQRTLERRRKPPKTIEQLEQEEIQRTRKKEETLWRVRRTNWKRAGMSDIDHAQYLWDNVHECIICGATNTRMVIDHDHKTGKVRGKICDRCNVIIGFLENGEYKLEKLNTYLCS